MPVYHEARLASLALYQQALRTAERVKTLIREIDDLSREVHQHLDDLDIIIEEIQGNKPHVPCAVENDSRCLATVQNAAGNLPAPSPLPIRSIPRVTRGRAS
jgi:hypothetical protein